MAPPPLVLVVDDYEDNRVLYAEYLAFAGYRVETAEDGAQAIAKGRALSPNLILMDLAMPGTDGWEATRVLKGDPATSGIIIIAVTGHTMPEFLHQALDAGADGVVKKPVEPSDLAAIVATFVRRAESPD